jgi:ABC-type Fe3+ transport system permease subunit
MFLPSDGEFIKDTLLLSSIATPIAGILGMIIAFLVVRKSFSRQENDGTGFTGFFT